MKRNLFFTIALSCASLTLMAQTPAIPTDANLEKKIDKVLKKMTLDDKVGQMVELEINQVTYTDPRFSLEYLMKADKNQIQSLLDEVGLNNPMIKAEDYVVTAPTDGRAMMKAYTLSQMIGMASPFKLDEGRMDSIFGKYRIGSILNVPRGTAQTPTVWNYTINTIQDYSLKKIGIPDVFGLDQMHGTTYTAGGTLFPSPINMAATFNRELAQKMGQIVAYETRACGVPWIYGPCIDLGRQQAWARQYEGFGEDAYLDGEIGLAVVRGMQGSDPNHIDRFHTASTLKHYFGYGVPDNGLDRTPATLSIQELREKQFAPFLKGFRQGQALAVMTNSSIVNGMNGVANKEFLTDWLKKGLNWDGMIVTDWGDIENLRERDHIVSTPKEGIIMAVNAGVDMIMVASDVNYFHHLKEAIQEGSIDMERIDDAVRRILRLKARLGLFETPTTQASDYPKFGSEEFAAYSRQASLESEVLLKNQDGILPLKKGCKILVTGPNANSMRCLDGGWSYSWQGNDAEKEEFTGRYNTIYEALQQKFGVENVVLEQGVKYNPMSFNLDIADEIGKAVAAAQDVDVIVACVGENSYAETFGNIPDITLSENQRKLVKALQQTGKSVILVLNEGRARIISDIVDGCKAVIQTILPGNYGGDALAELLAGDENFSGRLPYTYSANTNALVKYDFKACEVRDVMMDGVYNYDAKTYQQWWFGEGLSYTTFEYSNLKVDKQVFNAGDELTVTVDVKNTGKRAGKEVVMLFSTDLYASQVLPDNRRLREFTKIELQPGETQKVTLKIKASDLAYVNGRGQWMLEKGDFKLQVGNQIAKVNCSETYTWDTTNIPLNE